METVLNGLTPEACLVYLDDIIIVGKSFEEHLSNLRRVFEKLKEAKLKLNPSKCNLFRHEVNYLGHIISADGVRTDPQKVSAVKDWRRPKNVHELRSFLGLCTYYRRFVKGFSSIARPLHRLTENKQKFLWTDECEEAFNSLKAALTSFPILVYPDPEKQFILDTDASHESVGAVLSQEINGQEHVIAYWSKCLLKPERNYCVTRKELLAIVKAVENFHSYLYDRKFLLRTDHASLAWLLNFKNTEGQIARWIQKLEEYDFEIKHRKGSLHELLKNKANIEIPADKGRNMFGVVDDTFTLEYGEVFVQYSDWDSDVPIIVKGTVVVTKNPCMHPGDVRKFKAVDVEALHHIVDCIVFPAKGPRPHPDEMAGSDLDGDEYHVMWYEELIFDRDNYPPMAFALSSKDKPKDLNRPVMISDELDHFCEYIFNDKVGLIASSHLVFADQKENGIFSDTCIRLAKRYSIMLDFAKSGKAPPHGPKDYAFKYPDFMQKLNEKKTYLSANALGILFRNCKRLELGLETERNEIDYKMDEALIYEEGDKKYKKSAQRIYKGYCDKIAHFLNSYGFENEGQLLAGALINPPKFYENRHDLSNLMALMEFEVQWIFKDLEKKFFEEFGGKPSDGNFTEDMLRKASAWYVVTYSKNENSGTYCFGLPWAVADVLVELKLRNKNLTSNRNITSKSLLEEIVDKSVSKHFISLSPDEDSAKIHDNRLQVLEVAYKMLTKWYKSQREYFSDPDIKKIEKCISKEFDATTMDLVAGDVCFINKLKKDGNIKRAISPSHNVIETMLHIANLGIQNPQNHFSDVRQELGLLAWVTLIKLACTYNPQYLGVPNQAGEYASTIFYKSQDNIVDTLQLPLFEKNNILNNKFSIKLTHEMDEVKEYLKEQTKLKYIDFRMVQWRDGSSYVRITVQGTRYSVERFKDLVVMKDFFEAVVSEKPLSYWNTYRQLQLLDH
ncbi:RNA-dependent RNA polymerase 1 [Trichonephila clavata]|uniref:RNA-dependent RNA polymerase n=1 Tax=Trichonephila clavata TaxID=2740835 RepID=A0A8X6EZW8_TRICU|nr:RNA-dependent RNA polymerase 1 [Trichonephila clavata]